MKRVVKGEGFPGQRIVVLPRPVIQSASRHPLIGGLMPTDAGYFPRAGGHYRERTQGIDQAIFIYCTRGAGWCEMNSQRYVVNAGELLIIPPDMPHSYGTEQERPWSIYWLHAKGTNVGDFLRELGVGAGNFILRIGSGSQMVSLFEEILETVEHGYAQNQLLHASQILRHLLAVAVRLGRESREEQPEARVRVAGTVDYMKQHLDQPLKLDALAAIAGLSRSQYATLFKEQTGYAPVDYFTRLRIHQACQLLDTTSWPVKAVAARLGYEDSLHFSRVFRSVNEISPVQYRRLRKG